MDVAYIIITLFISFISKRNVIVEHTVIVLAVTLAVTEVFVQELEGDNFALSAGMNIWNWHQSKTDEQSTNNEYRCSKCKETKQNQQ